MLDPANINKSMAIPPALRVQYNRIILAGMQVMFNNKTHGVMLQQLKSGPDIVQNIATGIAGLMAILFRQSKNMPQQLIVPASLELMANAVDFVQRAKIANLTPQQLGQLTQATVSAVLQKFGVQMSQATQMLQQASSNIKRNTAPTAPGLIQSAAVAPSGGAQ